MGAPSLSHPWEKDSPLASNASMLSIQLLIQSSAAVLGSEVLEMMCYWSSFAMLKQLPSGVKIVLSKLAWSPLILEKS